MSCQPRAQSSSAISDVTSPVKLVGKIRTRFQASSGNSDSANWPGYEAVVANIADMTLGRVGGASSLRKTGRTIGLTLKGHEAGLLHAY